MTGAVDGDTSPVSVAERLAGPRATDPAGAVVASTGSAVAVAAGGDGSGVGDGSGAGVATVASPPTSAVAAELTLDGPPPLPAVTTTRMVWPRSASVTG
ncbi:MAG: hypothetical protein ACXVF0_20360 [Blastococcus sp.]